MSDVCPECGAPLPTGSSCRENFHALLFLEAEVPGGPSKRAHFFAVATYGLQHPASIGYTAETVEGLRTEVARVLSREATTEDVRRTVGERAGKAGRVTRRPGDPVPRWPLSVWPVTVAHVLAGGADEYETRSTEWAHSVLETIDGMRLES